MFAARQPVDEEQSAYRRDQPERQQQAERGEDVPQEVAEGRAD
jgi:hypothetical protein